MISTLDLLCCLYIVSDPSSKNGSKRKTLAEQTVLLTNTQDRLVALRRTTAAMQVLLARSVIMKALSLLSIRSVWINEVLDRHSPR